MLKLLIALVFLTISCHNQIKSDSAESGLSVSPITKSGIDSLLKASSGKVVLVNLWATWCGPCKEEMPDLIKLRNDLKEKNFELVLISLDEKDKISSMEEFLKNNSADFKSYYGDFSNDEEVINYFDKNWDGAIPATFIYDMQGNLSKQFVGKKSYDEFFKEVKNLM